MTAFLFILFVAAVITIEMFHRRKTEKVQETEPAPINVESVSGVKVSKDLNYHPFHTWARRIDAQTAAVGIDDFAQRLVGKVDKIVMPMPGTKLHAGQACVKIISDGREIALTAPMSGEVVEVNSELGIDPDALRRDPYGNGWLFQVRDWRLIDQVAALIGGERTIDWMRSCVQRIVGAEPAVAGAVLQDGGQLVEDVPSCLDRYQWIEAVREHLGTEPILRRSDD